MCKVRNRSGMSDIVSLDEITEQHCTPIFLVDVNPQYPVQRPPELLYSQTFLCREWFITLDLIVVRHSRKEKGNISQESARPRIWGDDPDVSRLLHRSACAHSVRCHSIHFLINVIEKMGHQRPYLHFNSLSCVNGGTHPKKQGDKRPLPWDQLVYTTSFIFCSSGRLLNERRPTRIVVQKAFREGQCQRCYTRAAGRG